MLLALLLVMQAPDTARLPWQQHVSYDITASLDEPRGVLGGTERVVYQNHSPDTLTTVSFHLFLNAFRPGSRWAAADSAEGRRRYNDLKDPDYGFNHVSGVTVDGTPVTAIYPLAPDSTIVRFVLPRPLPPGGSMTIAMTWDARPSTTPRRQGRQGRRFDFAQWYPKVVVYDRYGWEEHALYPAGEFYGEFGAFTVRLDVPQDQVIGATGVPVCGDPGWAGANRGPVPVEYQRDWYHNEAAFAGACDGAAAGRKRVVWYADKVHNFALSLNPEYRYEGGSFRGVAVHVLYQPQDSTSWGGGVAVERTATALAWLDQTFGKFGWPQITNVHRIEGGGTEFPMMIMDGSASQGLIVHELGHNYVMGLLANNEWKEGWLDEGFTSFQTSWFWETATHADAYPGTERFILGLDLDGQSEPPDLPGEDYRDFSSYNLAIYVRGELFFHQLRYIVGDSTMRAILHAFYDRYRYHHVDEDAFKRVAEEVSHRDLNQFFAQWLHTTVLYDYALGRVRRTELADGSWRTRAEVVRKAPGMIPVEVAFIAGADTTLVRTDGLATSAWVEAVTPGRATVVLDPAERTHDWNYLNNTARPRTDRYLDTFFSEESPRDALGLGIAPVAWFNDAGGLTVGARTRENYLGKYELNVGMLSYGTGAGHDSATGPVRRLDFAFRWKNPTALRATGTSQSFEVMSAEGRDAASVNVERTRQDHLSFGPTIVDGLSFQWLHARDLRFLDPSRWQLGGTFEAALSRRVTEVSTSGWQTELAATAVAGAGYTHPGTGTPSGTPYNWVPYGKVSVQATARRRFGAYTLGLRGFVGATIARDSMPRQALFYAGGAGPAAELWNPFLRSRGALLVRPDFYYHQPGDGNIRGLARGVAANHLATLGVELSRTLATRPQGHLFRAVFVSVFGDVGAADGDLALGSGSEFKGVTEAGVGVEARHRIGQTSFVTRFDFPLFVSVPAAAADTHPGTSQGGFRWLVSFEPGV